MLSTSDVKPFQSCLRHGRLKNNFVGKSASHIKVTRARKQRDAKNCITFRLASFSVGDWIDFTLIYIHLNSTICSSHAVFNIVIVTIIIIITMVIFIIIWSLDESGWISGSHLGGRHVSGPTLTAALHRATHSHSDTRNCTVKHFHSCTAFCNTLSSLTNLTI